MNRPVVFFLLLLFAVNANGQTANKSVTVSKDPRIDLLVKKQVESNEILTRDERSFTAGYRILVINTVDRAKATEAKTKMYQAFPELKSYLSFQAPKFHLKVGNFLDRVEAEAYLESIKLTFPTGVYIVRDTIEVDPVISADSIKQQP